MAETPKTPSDRLRSVMDALAESVAEAPDDEILAEANETHGDAARRAESVRALLRKAVDDFEANRPVAASAPVPVAPPAARRWDLRSWLALPAIRYAVASLAVAGLAAIVVYVIATRPDRPVDVVRIEPAPQPPAPAPPQPAPAETGPPPQPNPESGFIAEPPTRRPERPRPPRRPARTEPPPDAFEPDVLRAPRPRVPTADIRSVFVDLRLPRPSKLARSLRDAVVAHLKAGGKFSLHDAQATADARLLITQPSKGHFSFQLIGDEGNLWIEHADVSDQADAEREGTRIALKLASTVESARERDNGASQ